MNFEVDEAKLEQELQKTIRAFRLLGWGFLILGGVMLSLFLFAAFDPAESIRINGVETRDFEQKIGAAVFVGVFPIVGALLVLLPRKWIEPLFRRILGMVAETVGLKK
ncbi:MAG: hypothetical protein HZA93_23465 [Verrucomicrobia bacterium]|nr:hypothetical protein [Verrucomicrobiota bacterium]